MRRRLSRRDLLMTAKVAAASSIVAGLPCTARSRELYPRGAKAVARLDELLRDAVATGQVPGVVAMAATDSDIIYEGAFGSRQLGAGPPMTRDTVFRIASMVKPITTVAALQLVEQGKLSLDAPVPGIGPELASPQVLEGFDAKGVPLLRPSKGPILLRHLLTHTSGFTYRLWDAKAVRYALAIDKLPPKRRGEFPPAPLMFDPGERWHYGTSIDWVGRLVEAISGEPVDEYFRRHVLGPLDLKDTAFIISSDQRAREAYCHRRQADGSLLPQPAERISIQQKPAPHVFTGGGGIYATASDYLTFLRALLNGGTLGSSRVLRSDTVASMGQNQIGNIEAGIMKTTEPRASADIDFFPGVSLRWGFGHMINMQPIHEGRSAGSLTWAGLLNTYYWIDPSKRLAAVFMTQVLPFGDHRVLKVYREFERGIYAVLAG